MKKLIFVFAAIIAFAASVNAQVYVSGYTRSNGTYVQGHYRTSPNSTRNDNYSTIGNTNPYTGVAGTKPGDSYYSSYSTPSYSSYSTPSYSFPSSSSYTTSSYSLPVVNYSTTSYYPVSTFSLPTITTTSNYSTTSSFSTYNSIFSTTTSYIRY